MTVMVVGLSLWGCGSGQPSLPPNPAVDNRPAEIKEADDAMARAGQAKLKAMHRR